MANFKNFSHVSSFMAVAIALTSFEAQSQVLVADPALFDTANCVHFGRKPVEDTRAVRHEPAINFSDGRPVVSSLVAKNFEDILRLNELSYEIVRDQHALGIDFTPDEALEKNGWSQCVFDGLSGGNQLDRVGVVAFNKAENLLVIAFHGSRCGADWATNFDSQAHGESGMHGGFYRKYLQCRDALFSAVATLVEGLSPAERANLRIGVTGHSQGGGLAMAAVKDIAENFGEYYVGPGFDNALSNSVFALPLSGPAVCYGPEIRDAVDASVGRHNIIRLNVLEDAVPNATRAAGFYAPGYLALLDSVETHKRALDYSVQHGAMHWKNSVAYAHLGVGIKKADGKLSYRFSPAVINPDLQAALTRGYAYQPGVEQALSPLVSYPAQAVTWLLGDILATWEVNDGELLPNGLAAPKQKLTDPRDPTLIRLINDLYNEDNDEGFVGEGLASLSPIRANDDGFVEGDDDPNNAAATGGASKGYLTTAYVHASAAAPYIRTTASIIFDAASDIAYASALGARAALSTGFGSLLTVGGAAAHVYYHGESATAKQAISSGLSSLKSAYEDAKAVVKNIPHTLKTSYSLVKGAVKTAATVAKSSLKVAFSAAKSVWSFFSKS